MLIEITEREREREGGGGGRGGGGRWQIMDSFVASLIHSFRDILIYELFVGVIRSLNV